MARTSNGISDLIKQLSSAKVDGLNLAGLLNASASSGTTESKAIGRPNTSNDTKALSISGKEGVTGIQFGSPSSVGTSSTQSSSSWTKLLTQTASGGLSSVLSGGLGIAGLGGLVTGLLSIFGGGKSAPPPLVEFQLPDSQQETVYVGFGGTTTYQGANVVQPGSPSGGSGIYGSGSATPSRALPLQYQSMQIAQAVRNAVLNSSSLNDVIAEI